MQSTEDTYRRIAQIFGTDAEDSLTGCKPKDVQYSTYFQNLV